MTAIDSEFGLMTEGKRGRFLIILIEEILRRKPEMQNQLAEYMSRLGWALANGTLSPLAVLDLDDMPEVPKESHHDLRKAVQRFRTAT